MKRISAVEVHERKVRELGLDPEATDLTSVEALAASLRRSAGFMCPCSATTLVRAVTEPLRGLVADVAAVRASVEEIVEAVVGHGDLLEFRDVAADSGTSRLLLYAAPPSFVARKSGAVLLIGITADEAAGLPTDLESRVEAVNHVRRLSPLPGEDLAKDLLELGFLEVPQAAWLEMPAIRSASDFLASIDARLACAGPSGDIPGLTVLDPTSPVRYYRGRWRGQERLTGRFMGRRRQAYGADLWCYVQLENGRPLRMIDLPEANDRGRGCDAAWYLQMAIDASRGEPQRFRIRDGAGGQVVLDFFSPVPMWAQRRWDATGEPVAPSGSLVSYRFRKTEVAEEIGFLSSALWMQPVVMPGRAS